MKKLILGIVMLFLICGCSQAQNNSDDVAKQSNQDQINYNEVVKLNTLNHSMFESEKGFEILNINGTDSLPKYYHGNFDDDSIELVNEKLEVNDNYVSFTYYKDKWYYLAFDETDSDGIMAYVLYACDLEGNESEKIYELDRMEILVDDITFRTSKLFIHKDVAYVIGPDRLYIFNLSTKELKMMEDVQNIFINEEIMYVFCGSYDHEGIVYPWVVLECDLYGNFKSIQYERMLVTFIDESFVFYKKLDDGLEDRLYILNRDSEEEFYVEDILNCYGVLKENDMYVFETRGGEYNKRIINVMDNEGNILATKEHKEDLILQLLKEDKIYVTGFNEENNWIGYFKIEGNEISDLVKFD